MIEDYSRVRMKKYIKLVMNENSTKSGTEHRNDINISMQNVDTVGMKSRRNPPM